MPNVHPFCEYSIEIAKRHSWKGNEWHRYQKDIVSYLQIGGVWEQYSNTKIFLQSIRRRIKRLSIRIDKIYQ